MGENDGTASKTESHESQVNDAGRDRMWGDGVGTTTQRSRCIAFQAPITYLIASSNLHLA
jgi:hypothetical protein